MTNQSLRSELIGTKAFPAISILLPVNTPHSGPMQFRERLSSLIRTVEQELSSRYSKLKTGNLMSKLHHACNSIDLKSSGASIAIYISDKVERVLPLPFEVSERVVVDDSFEVRDLLYAAKMNKDYLAVIIAANQVKTFVGYGKSIIPVEMEGMPENVKDVVTEQSLPGWDYLDTNAWEENNVKRYIKYIDKVIQKHRTGNPVPVILLGDSKMLGHYKKYTNLSSEIIDVVEGNFEYASKTELFDKLSVSLQHMMKSEEEFALKELMVAQNRNQVSSGISQVWRSAAEARGRLLVVEKDYSQTGMLGEDGYTLIVDEESEHARNRIADAVDDIMEMVLKNKGDMIFVSNGALADHQRIALINRY